MDTVRQWVLTVAVAAVAGAVVLVLSPDGGINKSVRTAVSLFLVTAMILPFIKDFSFDFPDIAAEAYSEQPDLSHSVEEQMRSALKAEIEKILNESGIKYGGINIDMSISDNVIEVQSIVISVQNGENTGAVRKRISEETGAEVKFEVSG